MFLFPERRAGLEVIHDEVAGLESGLAVGAGGADKNNRLAGLQGAILLIAAKRQDAIAADLAQHDYDTNIAAKRDVEVLLAAALDRYAAERWFRWAFGLTASWSVAVQLLAASSWPPRCAARRSCATCAWCW